MFSKLSLHLETTEAPRKSIFVMHQNIINLFIGWLSEKLLSASYL
jgi:hypothetical protein